MSDKMLMGFSPLANYSTAPWGDLKVVDGKVRLDKVKAFNWARLMAHMGIDFTRLLRRGIWNTTVPFDWQDDGYFPMLKEYAAIIHQPHQKTKDPAPGIDVLIDPFDGCSEDWMYDPKQFGLAEELLETFFSEFKDIPYVKFTAGNEMNDKKNDGRAAQRFMQECLFPTFKRNGRMPFIYGATSHPQLENQKGLADRVWQMETTHLIWRAVHGVLDQTSESLLYAFKNWAERHHLILVMLSVDGVFTGASDCDWIKKGERIQRRPSPKQFRQAIRFWLDNVRDLWLPGGAPLYAFEYLPKAVNKRECYAQAVVVMAEEHLRKFGRAPANCGHYEDDWVEPEPPKPPEPKYVKAVVCVKSGLLPSKYCQNLELEQFEQGDEPRETCSVCQPKPSSLKKLIHWLFGPNSIWGKLFPKLTVRW